MASKLKASTGRQAAEFIGLKSFPMLYAIFRDTSLSPSPRSSGSIPTSGG